MMWPSTGSTSDPVLACLQALKTEQSYMAKFHSLACIQIMIEQDRDGMKSYLVKQDVVEALLECVKHTQEQTAASGMQTDGLLHRMRALVASMLWSLSIGHPSNKVHTVSRGALRFFLTILEEFGQSDASQLWYEEAQYATHGIWSVCYSVEENQAAAVQQGVLPLLHRLLRLDHWAAPPGPAPDHARPPEARKRALTAPQRTELKYAAAGALWHISSQPSNCEPILESGILEDLAPLLEPPPELPPLSPPSPAPAPSTTSAPATAADSPTSPPPTETSTARSASAPSFTCPPPTTSAVPAISVPLFTSPAPSTSAAPSSSAPSTPQPSGMSAPSLATVAAAAAPGSARGGAPSSAPGDAPGSAPSDEDGDEQCAAVGARARDGVASAEPAEQDLSDDLLDDDDDDDTDDDDDDEPEPELMHLSREQAASRQATARCRKLLQQARLMACLAVGNLSLHVPGGQVAQRWPLPACLRHVQRYVAEHSGRPEEYEHGLPVWTTMQPLLDLLASPAPPVQGLAALLICSLARGHDHKGMLYLEGAVPLLQGLVTASYAPAPPPLATAAPPRLAPPGPAAPPGEAAAGAGEYEVLEERWDGPECMRMGLRALATSALHRLEAEVPHGPAAPPPPSPAAPSPALAAPPLADWLRTLGLPALLQILEREEVDWANVCELTYGDLREMRLPIGPRRHLYTAILALRAARGQGRGPAGNASGVGPAEPEQPADGRVRRDGAAPDTSDGEEDPEERGVVGQRCVICCEAQPDTAFVVCGHVVCCHGCASCLRARRDRCPICRAPIHSAPPADILRLYTL